MSARLPAAVRPLLLRLGPRHRQPKQLDDAERAEILLALLRVHERRADEHGCLRAIAGIHSVFPGGVEKLARLAAKDSLKTFHAAVER